jgi:dTDP-4-amino-4,6-dideoxygalactose transaminase
MPDSTAPLSRQLKRYLATPYRLTGRGTAALWIALRTVLCSREGEAIPEVIIPDIICPVVADGILLAGAIPRFAAVSAKRFTITPGGAAACLTPHTAAILVAHTFGYSVDITTFRAAAPDVPIIEDAVQGIGGTVAGQRIGALGEVSFVSFDPTKIISGRGAVLTWTAPWFKTALQTWQAAGDRVDADRVLTATRALLPEPAASRYTSSLLQRAAELLPMTFPASTANVHDITQAWEALAARVGARQQRARWLADQLQKDAPEGWIFPQVVDGDAVWRYTFSAPSALSARQIQHHMARHGLSCTANYPPLSTLFGQKSVSADLRGRLVNLWVDDTATSDYLERSVTIIRQIMALPLRRAQAIFDEHV